MKHIFALAFVTAILSCSNSKNEQMADLLNRKKLIRDSIPLYKYNVDFFMNKAVDEKDSVLKIRYKDSCLSNESRRLLLKDKLEKVEFSIDSLQKMR
jgi:hypothetical protein